MSEADSIERLRRLREPGALADFASECLTVRTKEGAFKKLLLNSAQNYAHRRFEEQRAKNGRVRALVLKGRQQGISTYIAARYYQRASLRRGVNVYILSHEQSSSDTLFGIVDRYHKSNPLAPHVGIANTKEMEFDRLESSYAVATAGAKAAGRSKALTLFHGSEVAFWQNAKDHFAASVQAVPFAAGTEVILESTSIGPSGEFYERFSDAVAHRGDEDYQAVFIPWYLSPEYAAAPEPGFSLSEESVEGEMSEVEYCTIHNLSLSQMAWRRMKIRELRDAAMFRREYPATMQEAWSSASDARRFIPPMLIMRARKNPRKRGAGPLIIGVDPASGGGDRFAISWRRGMVVEKVDFRNKIDILEAFQWVKSIIERDQPARVYVDAGNIGADLITLLNAAGPRFLEVVRAVNFGARSEAKFAYPDMPGPANRRAEMYQRARDWLQMPEGASLPDDDSLEADMAAPREKPQLNNDFYIEFEERHGFARRAVDRPRGQRRFDFRLGRIYPELDGADGYANLWRPGAARAGRRSRLGRRRRVERLDELVRGGSWRPTVIKSMGRRPATRARKSRRSKSPKATTTNKNFCTKCAPCSRTMSARTGSTETPR